VDLVEVTWKKWIPSTPVYIWEKNIIMVKQDLKSWEKTSFNPPALEKEEIK